MPSACSDRTVMGAEIWADLGQQLEQPWGLCFLTVCEVQTCRCQLMPSGVLVLSALAPDAPGDLESSHRACLHAAAEKPPETKREIAQPRDGFTIENVKAQTVTPIPYDIVKEGIQT